MDSLRTEGNRYANLSGARVAAIKQSIVTVHEKYINYLLPWQGVRVKLLATKTVEVYWGGAYPGNI